ncbi:MAG TPA: hypothetical protein PKO06_17060, partial [Candidatus Ozemobacteraceae bacterium]|nr:hypothetical protein [Candidatus Ozemobacteraceae bacterium]
MSSNLDPIDRSLPEDHDSTMPLPEWERVFALVATVLVLFFYTRACPFPAGTYWDLVSARDFDINLGWTVMPEYLSFLVVQSPASLIGLKAIYHVVFFVLLGMMTVWVFRSREVMPGLLLLAIFAFGMQPLLTLRHLLQLLFLAGFFTAFSGVFLKNAFGVMIVPALAAAGAVGLNTWMLLVFVTCHALFRRGFQWTLVLCGLMGLLIFPESTTNAYTGLMPLAGRFMFAEDQYLLLLLGGIFLVPNLLALPMIDEESFPTMIFYALVTIASLLDPGYGPAFVLTGFFLLSRSLHEMDVLSQNVRIVGVILLAILIHLFLLYSPLGFKLNPTVRLELGAELEPVLHGREATMRVRTSQIGELAWKGMLNPKIEDLAMIQRFSHVIVKSHGGNFEMEVPDWMIPGKKLPEKAGEPSVPVDLPGKAPDAQVEPEAASLPTSVDVSESQNASRETGLVFEMPTSEELASSAMQRAQ